MTRPASCPHCSAEITSLRTDGKCPHCGKLLSTPDTDAGRDQITIKPTRSPSQQAGSSPSGRFGDYELIEEVARGGMGVVFKARHANLDRIVALKMILEGQLAKPEDIDRFKIEAQAAAHLDHPGIVQVYENGVIDGRHFFAMAFVEGQSLAQRIETAPLDDHQAATILLKITEAIDYAHQRGVIHRDLKPANILLDQSGNPRITDFGLAKRSDRVSGLTMTGQMLGTPSYMAPEQARGHGNIGCSTDVYALGAILYTMLSGKPPFEGATLVETLTKVMEQEPTPLKKLTNRLINADLETICLKCLEKDPQDRYPSAEALGEELKRFLNDEPIEARPLSALGKLKRWRQIIARNNNVRLQSSTRIWGVPLVDIALGYDREKQEEFGHAKGIFAYGDRATGIIAYGGFARGFIAVGMYSVGVLSFGLFSAGLGAAGFISLGLLASGGLTFGYVAFGLCAIGFKAIGMFSFGYQAFGAYIWSLRSP